MIIIYVALILSHDTDLTKTSIIYFLSLINSDVNRQFIMVLNKIDVANILLAYITKKNILISDIQ